MSDAETLAAIRELVKPQWRSIPTDLPHSPIQAFSQGRNWMLDRIREVLK